MPKSTTSRASELLSLLAETPTAPAPRKPKTAAKTGSPSPRPRARLTKGSAKQPKTAEKGRFSSIYLNPEDQKLLREFSMWFAAQGRKINDTLIIRAALRAAKPGTAFLVAYDHATLSDLRHKKK
jgi:hypothetical protein